MSSQDQETQFFQKKDGEFILNTDIWNNARVVGLTGYSIMQIKEPLYHLAKFIRENLTPDRLAGFNLEAILQVQDFNTGKYQGVLTNQ
jgi:hypothetical protein